MRLTNPGPVHGRTDCQVCPRSCCGPSLSHQGPSLIVVPGDLAEDSALWGEQTPRGQSQDSWGCTSPAAGTEGGDRLGEVERQLLLSLDRPRPLAPGWARQGGIAASGVKPRATGLSLGPRGPLGGGAGGWDWLSSYQILGELTHTFSLFEGPQLRSPPPPGASKRLRSTPPRAASQPRNQCEALAGGRKGPQAGEAGARAVLLVLLVQPPLLARASAEPGLGLL